GVPPPEAAPATGTPPAAPPLPGFSAELKAAMDSLAGSVEAPEAEGARAGDAAMDANATPGAGRGRTILVIEDDAAFAGAVKDLAASLDFDCLVTDNALDGLALARQHRPQGI